VKTIALTLTLMAAVCPTEAYAQSQAMWVAFDATFVRTEPGQRKVVGFFHRGTDGSTREESNVDGPASPVVLIMNITRRLQYRFEDGAWHSYPVYLSPAGWRPTAAAHDPRTYRPAAAIENIPVLRFVNAQGWVQFVAPSLNDFALKTERPNGGREVYAHIEVAGQPAGLFEPPPGIRVTAHTGGSGAIWYPPGGSPIQAPAAP
jgi:hypothetical protein